MEKVLLILLCLFTLISCKPSEQAADNLSNNNTKLVTRVDSYLESVSSLGFSGSIIVVEGSEILLQKGYGLANRENRTAYAANTIQSCGSVSKQFTAAAILLLESKGKLSVDDKLSNYFGSAPQAYQNITVHQLLTHSSGIIGGIGPDEEPIEKDAYLERLWGEPLRFEPGSGYSYSNAGYSLLGMIIEQLSGTSYEEFITEQLFIPSNMQNTGYIEAGKDTTKLAIGYLKGSYWGKVYKNGWIDDGPGWHLRANGGIHTTAEDMYQWLQVMQGNGVLNEAIIEKWTTGYVKENNANSRYAYGFVVYNHPKYGKMITHSGSNRIYSADLVWLPEKNLLYYIHSNTSLFPAYEVSNNVLSAAFDSAFKGPPAVNSNPSIKPESVKQLEGSYKINGGTLELTSDDIRLIARVDGQPMLDLLLNHSAEKKAYFSTLNTKTNKALKLLKEGKTDALRGLMSVGEDPVVATANLLKQIAQIGEPEFFNLVGTFENTENSRFNKYGAYTTFIHARFPNWNRYWNFVFDKDGKYVGTYSGPWPTFTMIPLTSDKFMVVRQEFPYNLQEAIFEENCLIVNSMQACAEE